MMFNSSYMLSLSFKEVSITSRPYKCRRPIDFHTT